ncbi:MAG TPA: FUSC family protein [Caulobacteraceae bacterium]|jgi:uncharacterized membrane protein YccC|nr:FUSC family protein [Caulobacteraceae bacterium]
MRAIAWTSPKLKPLATYAPQARHAVRVTVAASAGYALAHALNLPQSYWVVFSTVLVIQTSIGATLNLAVERLIGTMFGALVGGLAVWLRPQTPLGLGVALAVAVAITSFGAAGGAKFKVAPVTAVVMLVSPSGVVLGPLEAAVLRVLEIGLGSVIGLMATLFIFPARAHKAAAKRIQSVLEDLAQLIEVAVARLEGQTLDVTQLTIRLRSGLASVENAVAETARERSSRLGDDPLPEAVVRTLWRLRGDTVTLARIAEGGLPEPAGAHLKPAAQALLGAQAAFARACSVAMATGLTVDRAPLNRAHEMFQTAVEGVRREHLTRDLTIEAISPYFGLVFAAEGLHVNLLDLADRIEEAQGRRTGQAPTDRRQDDLEAAAAATAQPSA